MIILFLLAAAALAATVILAVSLPEKGEVKDWWQNPNNNDDFLNY